MEVSNIKEIQDFCRVTSYSLADRYHIFKSLWPLFSAQNMETAGACKTSITIFQKTSHHTAEEIKIIGEERTNRWRRYRYLFTINLISTCFGHHYAHRQENRLYKTACGVSLDVLAAVVWSQDTSWANWQCAQLVSRLHTINIYTCVICWFFLLLREWCTVTRTWNLIKVFPD